MQMTTRAFQYILEGMAGNVENNYNVITNVGEDDYDFYIASLLPEYLRENLHKEYVLGEEFANHLENVVIPQCTYAIFETERCKFPTMVFPDLRKRVVSEWLPTSGYQLKNAPEVVLSHWYRVEKSKERYMELWIPVEKL